MSTHLCILNDNYEGRFKKPGNAFIKFLSPTIHQGFVPDKDVHMYVCMITVCERNSVQNTRNIDIFLLESFTTFMQLHAIYTIFKCLHISFISIL